MNNKVVRFLEEPAVLSFRNQLLIILCLIATLVLTWAFRVESKEVLSTSNQAHWGDRQYAHLWVSREGVVTGARIEDNRMVFERGPLPGGFQETSIVVARPAKLPDFVWAADRDANYVAWADGGKISIAKLDFARESVEASSSVPLKQVRGLNILNSELVQAILSDGSVRVWNVARQELVEEPRIQFSGLEQVAGFGEYLGGASAKRLTLFRTVDGVPRMIDQADAPAAKFRLVIPGAGQIAALWSGGIVARGLKINTPGPVRAAALTPDNALAVAGDFQNILHCTPQECRAIAPVDSISVLVSNDRFLAYSGEQGTGVRPFVLDRIFTRQGQVALWIGGGMLALVCLLLLTGLVLRMMAMAIEEKRNRLGKLPTQFPLPGGLLQAFVQGRVVLWAGSGISAQVGLPTRTEFVRRLIDTAETEHWIDKSGGELLMANVDKGRGEECVAAVVKRLGGGRNMDLQSCFRMMYRRICLMTPMFESLNKLPFSAAITTNYDTTLERMGPRWQNAVIPIPYNPLVAMKDQQFFLWKLYGDMQGQAPLILSRLELADTLAKISVMPDVVDRLSRTKTFFFIGASLEGLIADLRMLGFKAQRGEKHYAFATACGNGWKKQAECLREEFGVEVAVVAENVVERALPELLQHLVETLAHVQARRSSQSPGTKVRAVG
jgi:hypothetical protein